MARESCDGCGASVPIAGGIANLWTLEKEETGGITLVLADDSEHFLCFECVQGLPNDREPTAADVDDLSPE